MIKRKRNYFLIILIILIVIPNSKMEKINNHNNNNNNNYYLQSSDSVSISEINFHNIKGSNVIFWDLTGSIVGSNIPDGSYMVQLQRILNLDNLYDYNGNSYTSTLYFGFGEGYGVCYGDLDMFRYEIRNAHGYGTDPACYLLNTTSDCYYNDNSLTLYMGYSNYISGTSITTSSLSYVYLRYSLSILLSIDSEYYNLGNIRVYSLDKKTNTMIEQDPNDIIIQHPEYKLFIYSKETNDLLYQDDSYQMFKYFRIVSIDSFKFQNNFDEMVNCTIKNNTDQTIVYQTLTNPYSNSITNLTTGTYDLQVSDIYGESLYNETFSFPLKNNVTYTPINYRECFITYFDQSGSSLDFKNYKVEVNGSIIYSQNIFKPINTFLNITTYDIFDRELDQQNVFVNRYENYFGISLQQYPLRIRNNQVRDSLIEIKLIPETSFKITTKLASNDITEFKLYPDTYNITYSNEFLENESISIELNEASAITLDTKQKIFVVGLFDESGFGVSFDNVRVYFDGSRTNGFIQTFDGIHNIKILDYFNTTLFDQDINITSYSEINIYLPIYTLIIWNYSNETMEFKIKRESNPITLVDQMIPAQFGYTFRFAKNIRYQIKWYDLDGKEKKSETVELNENLMIASFGYISTGVININTITGLDLIVWCLITGVAVYQTIKQINQIQKRKTKRSRIPTASLFSGW